MSILGLNLLKYGAVQGQRRILHWNFALQASLLIILIAALFIGAGHMRAGSKNSGPSSKSPSDLRTASVFTPESVLRRRLSDDVLQDGGARAMETNEKRVGRWYFGGLAGAGAAMCTHPLDLIKVQLQTQQAKIALPKLVAQVYRTDGIMGFYNGLTASVLRQMTYSLARFAVYEGVKKQMADGQNAMPFYQKVFLAGFSGAIGGVVGQPADLVNVRMQNDMKLAAAERRNYKHAVDGILQIARNEGVPVLFNGVSMCVGRAVLMTIGQLSFYDQVKQVLMSKFGAPDTVNTHLFSSFLAASAATVLTQPMDVLKTRMMNAPPGTFKGPVDCFVYTAKTGPTAFYKGFVPAFVRLAPHTILMLVFFEQFRLRFGYLPEQKHAARMKKKVTPTFPNP